MAENLSPVEQYISEQPEAWQERLLQVRQAILAAEPGMEEKIAWGMPTFRLKRNIIHFALAKQHIGLYPGPAAVAHFADRLTGFPTSEGAIQLPHKKELPLPLITEITAWCVAEAARIMKP